MLREEAVKISNHQKQIFVDDIKFFFKIKPEHNKQFHKLLEFWGKKNFTSEFIELVNGFKKYYGDELFESIRTKFDLVQITHLF